MSLAWNGLYRATLRAQANQIENCKTASGEAPFANRPNRPSSECKLGFDRGFSLQLLSDSPRQFHIARDAIKCPFTCASVAI